jgi:hypothetical protein
MKHSKIALASMMVTGFFVSASAATTPKPTVVSLQCDMTSPVKMVNTCAPEVTLYVAGSSALGGAISKVVPGLFNTTVTPMVTVLDGGSNNGFAKIVTNYNKVSTVDQAANGVSAFYGLDKTTGKRTLIVYNSMNGSAAGVSQVMATTTNFKTINESEVVSVGPSITTATVGLVAKGSAVANSCVAYDGTNSSVSTQTIAGTTKTISTAANTVLCTSAAPLKADMAISDVDVPELVQLYTQAAATKLTTIKRTPLGMQGFAVAVNNNFYNALQDAQVSAGLLDSTCNSGTARVLTEACQPNITRAQYASLASVEGSIGSAAGFIAGDTTPLTFARRDQLSGTQATSNIFFLSNSCNVLDAASKVNTRGGALTPLHDGNIGSAPSKAGLIIHMNAQTGNVEDDLKSTTGYAIGTIALSKAVGQTAYKFVKLDGVSPNYKGSVAIADAASSRAKMLDGTWPMQVVSYAVTPATYAATDAPKQVLSDALISALKTGSTANNLNAIGYFFGDADKVTKVSRLNGNNCSPLIVQPPVNASASK